MPSLCVLTDLWLKGRLGIHPAVKMPLSTSVVTPPFIHASASQCTLPLGSTSLPFGSLFEHINAPIKIWVLFSGVPRVCSAPGQETQIKPLHSALAECELVCHCLPTLSQVLYFCYNFLVSLYCYLKEDWKWMVHHPSAIPDNSERNTACLGFKAT